MVNGTFVPEGSTTTLNYQVDEWWDDRDRQHRKGSLTSRSFMRVDRMTVHVTGKTDNGTEVDAYCTVWGPFELQSFISDTLAGIFGSDGSMPVY